MVGWCWNHYHHPHHNVTLFCLSWHSQHSLDSSHIRLHKRQLFHFMILLFSYFTLSLSLRPFHRQYWLKAAYSELLFWHRCSKSMLPWHCERGTFFSTPNGKSNNNKCIAYFKYCMSSYSFQRYRKWEWNTEKGRERWSESEMDGEWKRGKRKASKPHIICVQE